MKYLIIILVVLVCGGCEDTTKIMAVKWFKMGADCGDFLGKEKCFEIINKL